MPLHYIISQKNRKQLMVKGYIYNFERASAEKSIWKCVEYFTCKCKGRIHTQDDNIILEKSHGHPPNAGKITAKEIMSSIKERAVTTQESTHSLAAVGTIGLPCAVSGHIPPVENIKKIIRYARHGEMPLHNPRCLEELVIPEQFSKTLKEEKFLLYDSGVQTDRILIFSTLRNLDFMAECPNWFADGTFKATPPLFSQIYTIHGVKYDNVIPSVYVLMPNKREETYNRVFTVIKSLKPNLQPKTVMTDFEKAAINAFKNSFPNIIQRGCFFFHLSQCVYRKIQSAGLQSKYDPNFVLEISQLAALAFVPTSDVIEPIINYFEDTWIGRFTRRGQRRRPVFDISLWNCYDAVKDKVPRTNNAVEGWHRRFNELMNGCHPTIWKFIDCLKKEQNLNSIKIEQYIAGHHPPVSRKVYRDTSLRIQKIVNDYNDRPILDYLRGIAYNFQLQV
ncbi:uncharacterized protein LOC118203773 [Stegodyphus dumicola]|uniref:uncharacterized protein LOC118203773 n=1 Tax=Stegodyphus dumicola TaxID=202533 RepID=UPI0015A77F67|nr:uncharacterized protein LOC118203773 [Stegodyphus dumicola]